MITENKRQEQISERQRAEMKANAGKPVKFDFRSADELRADWDKQKAQAEAAQAAGKRKAACQGEGWTLAVKRPTHESWGNPSDPYTYKS